MGKAESYSADAHALLWGVWVLTCACDLGLLQIDALETFHRVDSQGRDLRHGLELICSLGADETQSDQEWGVVLLGIHRNI